MTDYPNTRDVSQNVITATHRFDAVDLALSGVFFTADRALRVVGIRIRSDVAGTDLSAVTAVVRKVPAASAVSAGTALHSGTANLKAAASSVATLTLSATASDLALIDGDSLGLHLTGVPTLAQGAVTVFMVPA